LSTHRLTSLAEKSIPLFVLIQKVAQKNQGKSDRSAGFAGLTHKSPNQTPETAFGTVGFLAICLLTS